MKSKLPKKLRTKGHKFSVPPDIEALLNIAADRIEELEARVRMLEAENEYE
jgi:hypothetical protein